MGYLRMEEVMKLLGTRPPGTPLQLDSLCDWANRLVKRHGELWVRQNRQRILEEWKFILDFGL